MTGNDELIGIAGNHQVETLGEIDDGYSPVRESTCARDPVDQRNADRLDRDLQSLSAGIARLERKLDRILALVVESRGRNR
jgi:hypothetical protein